MKKILASCFALTMTACLALPLAACGGGGKLVSERLPEGNFEEAWKAAFSHLSDENIKIEFEVKGESSEEGAKDIRYGQTVSRNGDIERWTTSEDTVEDNDGKRIVPASDIIIDFSSDPIQGYVCVTDGGFHAFKPKEWTSLAEYMAMDPHEDSEEPIVTQIRYFNIIDGEDEEEETGELSDFYHYSKKDGGYVYEEDYSEEGENGSLKQVIKFKDGKIAYVCDESSGIYHPLGDEGYHVTYTWTVTYGGQDVHLPSDEECDHGVRAIQSDILPEAGFAEAVEKAFDIYDSENIKIEFGSGESIVNGNFYSGKLIHADKKEYYLEYICNYRNYLYDEPLRIQRIEGYCDLRGESPIGFLQYSNGSRIKQNAAMFGEEMEDAFVSPIFYPFFSFSEIKSDPQKLHYSEEEKGYVWEDDGEEYIVKFKNGKLASIWTVGGLYEYNYMIFTYGGQKVTLPDDMSAE